MPILRVTLFKIPEEADIQTTLAAYEKLSKDAVKVEPSL
jgi:hypothetical protein